jgi:hypothetical protein
VLFHKSGNCGEDGDFLLWFERQDQPGKGTLGRNSGKETDCSPSNHGAGIAECPAAEAQELIGIEQLSDRSQGGGPNLGAGIAPDQLK